MGLDAWTRTPHERALRERADEHARKGTERVPIKEKIRRKWHGEGTCACGCKKPATAFRGGKMYNSGCVGSKWAKAGLPQDRTPPSHADRAGRRRQINGNSRRLDRE